MEVSSFTSHFHSRRESSTAAVDDAEFLYTPPISFSFSVLCCVVIYKLKSRPTAPSLIFFFKIKMKLAGQNISTVNGLKKTRIFSFLFFPFLFCFFLFFVVFSLMTKREGRLPRRNVSSAGEGLWWKRDVYIIARDFHWPFLMNVAYIDLNVQ